MRAGEKELITKIPKTWSDSLFCCCIHQALATLHHQARNKRNFKIRTSPVMAHFTDEVYQNCFGREAVDSPLKGSIRAAAAETAAGSAPQTASTSWPRCPSSASSASSSTKFHVRLHRWAREPPQTLRAGEKKKKKRLPGGKRGRGEHPSTRPRYVRFIALCGCETSRGAGGGVKKSLRSCRTSQPGGDISQRPVVTPSFKVLREQQPPTAVRCKSNSYVDSPEMRGARPELRQQKHSNFRNKIE